MRNITIYKNLNQLQENPHQSLHCGPEKVRLHIYTLHLLSSMYTSFWKIDLERKKKCHFCLLSRIIFYALMPQIDFLTYVHKIKLRMLSTFIQLCTTVFTMCINSLSIECSCTELVKLFFFLSIRVYVFIYMHCHKLCLRAVKGFVLCTEVIQVIEFDVLCTRLVKHIHSNRKKKVNTNIVMYK